MRIEFTKEMAILDHDLRDKLRTATTESSRVELDFQNLRYIDSTAVDMVTKLCKEVTERGGIVKAMNMSEYVTDILDICGTLTLLEI